MTSLVLAKAEAVSIRQEADSPGPPSSEIPRDYHRRSLRAFAFASVRTRKPLFIGFRTTSGTLRFPLNVIAVLWSNMWRRA